MLCEDRGRDWSGAATSQGMPGATRIERGQEGFSPEGFRENTGQLTLQLPASNLQICVEIIYFFKPSSLWYFVMAPLGK